MKSDKTPYIIYADLESLIKKIDVCENNPENSSATKIDERIPCGYSISKVGDLIIQKISIIYISEETV